MIRVASALLAILTTTAVVLTARQIPSAGRAASADDAAVADRLIAQMTLDEKIAMLHGGRDPENVGQAGYIPGVPRLGVPPLRLSDGPAGVRTGRPATALPAPVALASTFSPELAQRYGQAIGIDGRALRQDVMLAPMVNIVRVPQGGRNFETLGEDPLLASRLVAAEISGIQSEGLMATVKHFAENNQENARQSVSADVDERTMHEIELPAFEAAVRAHVASVMCSYNKVNGTYACENGAIQNDVLRTMWKFDGFVMSDWGATHSAAPALIAGLDLEMPGGGNYTKLPDAIRAGQLSERVVDQAVHRILVQMARFGLLTPGRPARTIDPIASTSKTALDVAIAGAVLLKNTGNILPVSAGDLQSLAVFGPTAKTLLVGGGGSARVPPMHTGSVVDELQRAAGSSASISHLSGYDLDGEVIPVALSGVTSQPGVVGGSLTASGTSGDKAFDLTGARALPAGVSVTWTGTMTAKEAGNYEIRLQTSGGRGSIQFETAAGAAPPTGRGGRGAGGGAASLLPTAGGLTNAVVMQPFEAGQSRTFTLTATAGASSPMEIRLAWIPPGWRTKKIAEAADAARKARTAIVFAYDEGSEGRDRPSISLPGEQDQLIEAIAAANPRTVVVLNNGAPIVMPWADHVAAILQMWYPGQEGAKATSDILTGAASPGGRLPVTFPRRLEDGPTADPARYPGVDGHGEYSEGILVGYRWYDTQHVEPLFPFGHGLSYTTFAYSNASFVKTADGLSLRVTVKNTGTRAGDEVVQVYAGPPPSPAVPIAAKSLAAFQRVTLAPGAAQVLTLPLEPHAWSYWSTSTHAWEIAPGMRTFSIGASSRDIRLTLDLDIAHR